MKHLLTGIAIILTCLVAACTSVAPASDSATGGSADSSSSDSMSADSMGGTLTIASTQDIDNYDPHWNQLIAYSVLVGHNVFDYLTKLDADMNIVPALAESWEISDDGTTYTFQLREGATFHNGRALVADDVVFSFNRLTEQETIYATKMDPVEAVEAVDERTVQFTLKAAWAPFLEDVAAIAIVASETVDDLSKAPIGSGPFRFVEWEPNDRIVLEKNADYGIDGVPKLDGIEIKILPDYAVALTNLDAGSVDAVYKCQPRMQTASKGAMISSHRRLVPAIASS